VKETVNIPVAGFGKICITLSMLISAMPAPFEFAILEMVDEISFKSFAEGLHAVGLTTSTI